MDGSGHGQQRHVHGLEALSGGGTSSAAALYATSNGSSTGSALHARATGFGRVATFEKDNTTGNAPAVRIQTNNAGPGLDVFANGTGTGARIQIDNTASTATGLQITHNGNNSTALRVDNTGTGGATNAIVTTGSVVVGGTLFANVKNFVQPHARDASREIRYVTLEGPESAVFVRGTAQLVDGRAVIALPEHFAVVAAEDGIVVQFTPRSLDSKGLAAIAVTRERVEVGELLGGAGSYAFDYFVTAEREGFEGRDPVVPNVHFRPEPGETAAEFEQRFSGDDVDGRAMRRMLVANGLLGADGRLDLTKLAELGWSVADDRGVSGPALDSHAPAERIASVLD